VSYGGIKQVAASIIGAKRTVQRDKSKHFHFVSLIGGDHVCNA